MSILEARDYHYSNGSIAGCENQADCGFEEHLTLNEAFDRAMAQSDAKRGQS